jgi:hypothetical protein
VSYINLKRNDTNIVVSHVIDDPTANLSGAKVTFILRKVNGPLITYAPAVIADVLAKKVTYTLKASDTLVSGNFNAEFAVEFADGRETSYPQNGYLQLIIQPNADDEKSTYLMDNVAARVSEIQLLKGEIEGIISNLTTMGDSSVEVVSARVEADGTNHSTLKERLDAKDLKLETIDSKVESSQLTNDLGAPKFSVTSTSGNILDTILTAGVGMHSFYAASGSGSLPPSNISIRGIAHVTNANPTIAYVWAIDYQNTMYTNYFDSGTWKGWKELAQTSSITTLRTEMNTQGVLWENKEGIGVLMVGGTTITPTKSLNSCKNGWLLVWSDMGDEYENNYDFCFSHIPKYMTKYSGAQHLFALPIFAGATSTQMTVKKLNVTNTTITGHDDNSGSGDTTNARYDACLRAVLEW